MMSIRKSLLIPGFVLFFLFTNVANAQHCEGYHASKKGTRLVFTTYDKGDQSKVLSTATTEVVNNKGTVINMHIVTTDDKGKELVNSDFTIECKGDASEIDQKTIIRNQMKATMKDPNTTAEVSGSNLVIPHVLSVGQTLPDNEIDITIRSSISLTAKVKVLNRKIIGQESVTVPAGTFDCMVVTYDSETQILGNKKTSIKAWIAKGVGVIKEEVYGKKNRLEKNAVLTSLSE
jgi:hypothetical protein